MDRRLLDLTVYESKYWIVKLNKDQYHLWRLVFILKRDCETLSDLSEEEFLDYRKLVIKFEIALKKAFWATMFNWACLMNRWYKTKPYNPHIHFHLKPRYEKVVKFNGVTFTDKDFWSHYDFKNKKFVEGALLLKIRDKIISSI